MNIVFSGLHGTGKSTIAKLIAEEFEFESYSTGMAFRSLAKEKGMTLEEFSEFAEGNLDIDRELDERIKQIAKDARENDENYVFDGQLPAYILENLSDYNIYLKTETETRIARMSKRDDQTLEEKKHETLVRERSEQERFQKLYEIDVLDPSSIVQTFHLIVDTTKTGISEVFDICKAAVAGQLHN